MELPHQALGYDRAITIFAPDGRIIQVEYAKQAVKAGSTAIGITCKDGAVIIADKRIISKLIVPSSVEKIFIVDDHIIATFAGLISDGRVLIERAQIIAQEHKILYGTPIDLKTLVKEIADIKQIYTQYGGLRPFGVSIIFAGVNEDGQAELYVTEPMGVYYQYKAAVIGEGENKIWPILEKEYREDLTIDEAIKLGLKAMKKALDKDFDINRIDIAVVTKEGARFLTKEEKERYLKEIEEEKKEEAA